MISIFYKPAFLNINPSEPFYLRKKPPRGHLMRVSSIIRGDQIAKQIGAKLNPESGYENDVCIYVKPQVRKGGDFEFKGRVNYLDMIDGHNLAEVAKKHPEVGVIVCSKADYNIMSKEIPNKIVLIPQHHCNFERTRKTVREIKRIGVIGTRGAFPFLPKELKPELSKRGIELVEYSQFFSRENIIDFYMDIDLQIVWRPYRKILSNPLKLVNASSFGIPTVALDEKAFWELKGIYIPVGTLESLLEAIDSLVKSPDLYFDYSIRCIEKAEEYHIENIGKLYEKL
jgi:hypothetical protein